MSQKNVCSCVPLLCWTGALWDARYVYWVHQLLRMYHSVASVSALQTYCCESVTEAYIVNLLQALDSSVILWDKRMHTALRSSNWTGTFSVTRHLCSSTVSLNQCMHLTSASSFSLYNKYFYYRYNSHQLLSWQHNPALKLHIEYH